jgi:membrane-associated phospholipid phosphatase
VAGWRGKFLVALAFSWPVQAVAESRLQWKDEWRRFGAADIAFTLGAGAWSPILILTLRTPPTGWHRPLLFDTPVRDGLAIEADGDRHRTQIASDVIQYALGLYPFVVDAALVAGLLDRNFEVASQMALIDTEAFVLESLLVVATKRTIGRVRPGTAPCDDGDYACRNNSQRRSFISGHAAASFTGAGLICLHHRELPLYGSPAAGGIACATGLALALTDGILRIAADDHWATDVIASGAIGLVAGYVVPHLLHYSGPTDGHLDGMLHLGAVAGASRSSGETRFATGVAADARQFWWWDDDDTVGLEFAGGGLLSGTSRGHYFREGRASLRWWAKGFAIGPELAYRAEILPVAEDRDQLAAGGSIAFGHLEEEMQVILQTSWLPLGQGELDLVEASLEVAAFRYGMISLRVRRPIHDRGALFFASLGGRLPW